MEVYVDIFRWLDWMKSFFFIVVLVDYFDVLFVCDVYVVEVVLEVKLVVVVELEMVEFIFVIEVIFI